FGVREVSRRLGMSHTTISQWETGKRVPHPEDVAAMLAAIGLTGERREEILDLARGAADSNWLAAGGPGASAALAGIVECERTATEIIEWSPLVIPGLLQTPDCARAIIGSVDSLLPKEVEARVRVRADRRAVLTDERDGLPPAEYTALIGEWALRQRIGGMAVFAAQLCELLTLVVNDFAVVRVVPVQDDYHPGLAGSFILYNFEEAPSIVHLESYRSSVFLYDEESVAAFRVATNQMLRRALEPKESAALIAQVVEEIER
ncbi:helix-turn-helix domain-containing protein, partial [Actinokineospora sp.]|uniref:helix-turn-helix domain-containing protein n=1 Tax=Actinokineospora sp. TaxID=1872133 RepID=UPI003D6C3172